jgi:hypothetical protein
MFRSLNKRINYNSLFTKVGTNSYLKFPSFNFSSGGGHGHSDGSDSEHGGHHSGHSEHSDHDHEHDAHEKYQVNPPLIDYPAEVKARIFSHRKDAFSVDKILSQAKKPLIKHEKLKPNDTAMFQTEKEYIDFLADSFARQAGQKYPNYKKDSENLKNRIKDFDSLNRYQQEVFLLQEYLTRQLEDQSAEIHNMLKFNGSPLEAAKAREHFLKSKFCV